MTLQLVYDGLGVSLHVEEVDAGILAASHCVGGGQSGDHEVRGEEILQGQQVARVPGLSNGWMNLAINTVRFYSQFYC